ncbi:MAG: LAGLIDADG family homing endonuclease, partial [Candidatus Thorarchaeota archaeon]
MPRFDDDVIYWAGYLEADGTISVYVHHVADRRFIRYSSSVFSKDKRVLVKFRRFLERYGFRAVKTSGHGVGIENIRDLIVW